MRVDVLRCCVDLRSEDFSNAGENIMVKIYTINVFCNECVGELLMHGCEVNLLTCFYERVQVRCLGK